MDNKKMFIGMAIVLMIVLGWQGIVNKYFKPMHPEYDWNHKLNNAPEPAAPAPAPQPAAIPATQPTTSPAPFVASTNPSFIGPSTAASGDLHVSGLAEKSGEIELGSFKDNDETYPIGMKLTSIGAGISSVTLNQYKAPNDINQPYTFLNAYANHDDDSRSLATRSITVNGQTLDVTTAPWSLEKNAPDTATYGIYIDNAANQHVLHVTKKYSVESQGPKTNRDNTAAGYEATVTYRIEAMPNAPQTQTVRIAFDGPTVPPREVERGPDRLILSGYDAGNNSVDLVHHGIEEFKAGADNKDLLKHDKGYKLLWAGTGSNYFGAIVRPDPQGSLAKAEAKSLDPQSDKDHQVVLNLETADIKIDRGTPRDIPFKIFLGPKKRDMLEGDYYHDFPRAYNLALVTSGSMCGMSWCASARLIDWLVDLLRGFHWLFHDWGLAIIFLVILVRLCLHPITKSSQVSMMKMQKMGPELERLKKKFGDDKEAYAKAQMQVYKEVGFTPILGCLPMFLQMPIWIALYSALQSEIALRQAPFLWGWTWIHDLASPDRLWHTQIFPFTIPWIGYTVVSLNILPIFMAFVFFLQQKYTPKPPAATPEQAQQQKMMQWMSLLFPIFLYTAPSGLNLYILTSTAIGVVESKRIRDHIKQRQDAEKAGKVIIDAKPTRAGKQSKKDEALLTKETEKPGCITGWWVNMQNKVEEVRKQAERAKNNKDKN